MLHSAVVTHVEFMGRCDEEIEDTDVLQAHSACADSLKRRDVFGVWYTGETRNQLRTLMKNCEDVILGVKTYRQAFKVNPAWLHAFIINHG